MTTFDRYLLGRYLKIFLILFLSLYGLFVVFDGFTNVDSYQDTGGGSLDVIVRMGRYYLLQSSAFFGMVGPLVSVMAMMVVVGMLYRKSEIQPVFAAGIPVYRVIYPFVLGTVIVNGILICNQELVLPRIGIYLLSRSGDTQHKLVDPILDHATHIHIDGQSLDVEGQSIRDARFTLPPRIAGTMIVLRSPAARAVPESAGRPSGWLLETAEPGLSEVELTAAGSSVVRPLSDGGVFIASGIGFEEVYERDRSFQYLSSSALRGRLSDASLDHATARSQAMHLHNRFLKPIANVLSVLVAVPLLIRKESRSLILNAAYCTTILGLLYGLDVGCQYLGAKEVVSAALAACIPTVVTGSLAAWVSADVLT